MAVLSKYYKIRNSSGEWDTIYFRTQANLVAETGSLKWLTDTQQTWLNTISSVLLKNVSNNYQIGLPGNGDGILKALIEFNNGSVSPAQPAKLKLSGDIIELEKRPKITTIPGSISYSDLDNTDFILKKDLEDKFNSVIGTGGIGTISGRLQTLENNWNTWFTAANDSDGVIENITEILDFLNNTDTSSLQGILSTFRLKTDGNFAGVAITASSFTGNASGLTNIPAPQLSGTVPIGILPTGTGSTQVALGNHNHNGVYSRITLSDTAPTSPSTGDIWLTT